MPKSPEATPAEVAAFMHERLKRDRILYQETVVYEIQSKFGERFTYINANGNYGIAKEVLKEWNKLTKGTVVWSRSERYWRKREPHDDPKTRQVD